MIFYYLLINTLFHSYNFYIEFSIFLFSLKLYLIIWSNLITFYCSHLIDFTIHYYHFLIILFYHLLIHFLFKFQPIFNKMNSFPLLFPNNYLILFYIVISFLKATTSLIHFILIIILFNILNYFHIPIFFPYICIFDTILKSSSFSICF